MNRTGENDFRRLTVGAWGDQRQSILSRALESIRVLFTEANYYDATTMRVILEEAANVSYEAQADVQDITVGLLNEQLRAHGGNDARTLQFPRDVRTLGEDSPDYSRSNVVELFDGTRSERINTATVFERAAVTYRAEVRDGTPESHARHLAVVRAEGLVEDNVMLAQRETENAVLTNEAGRQKILGYRRVIHAELSKGGVCGLCLAASTRRYTIAELKAIHNRCKCTVEPLFDTRDLTDEVDFEELYDAAGDTAAKALSRIRYRINDHGELGRVLTAEPGTTVETYEFAA
ncbi:hypothetical protein D1O33_00480 [Rhodococcus rhodochrous]|nr:hypothetical protein D1O33_00480 [Rhodococcus rhodochrous]